MNDPSKCEHDWRRVFPSDINPEWRDNRVVAVLCCGCGVSPVRMIGVHAMAAGAYRVNGDWPSDHRITGFYEGERGPSVEFEIVRADGSGD